VPQPRGQEGVFHRVTGTGLPRAINHVRHQSCLWPLSSAIDTSDTPSVMSASQVCARSRLDYDLVMEISTINFVTTRLEIQKGGGTIGGATGFFFHDGGREFLATNRHVVVDEEGGQHPDALKMLLHANRADLKATKPVVARLQRSGAPTWLQHPDYDLLKCDVVLVPMDPTTLDQQNLMNFKGASITCTTSEIINTHLVNPFGDLAIVGYPRGFHDAANNLPVYRRASVASCYGVDFNGMPYFLVDANLHPGTSGSPVVNTHHTLWGGPKAYTLFGVHSAQHVVRGEPLGLNVVWYANLLPEIARQIHRQQWNFV
jgi:hypothetical protein